MKTKIAPRKALLILALFISAVPLGQVEAKNKPHKQKQVIDVAVTEKGFEPGSFTVNSQIPVEMRVTRKTDATCAKEIAVPSMNIRRALPLNAAVSIDLGRLLKGELKFACGMNMISGVIITE